MKAPRTSRMAIISAAAALMPGVMFIAGTESWSGFFIVWGPIVSLVLAILSLLRIKVSAGELGGRTWALSGLIISFGVLLIMLGFLGLVFGGGGGLAK